MNRQRGDFTAAIAITLGAFAGWAYLIASLSPKLLNPMII